MQNGVTGVDEESQRYEGMRRIRAEFAQNSEIRLFLYRSSATTTPFLTREAVRIIATPKANCCVTDSSITWHYSRFVGEVKKIILYLPRRNFEDIQNGVAEPEV